MIDRLLVAAWLAGYAGFVVLALSMPRHGRELAGDVAPSPTRRGTLRAIGALALIGSVALAVWRDGAAFGGVLGVMLLSASAAAVALTVTARPRWLRALAGRLLARPR